MPSTSAEARHKEAEAKAAFHLRLRARGLRDIDVLRAMERVPRRAFVPHHYLDLAERDLALPIAGGQTLNEPWLIGRMIEALDVRRESRVLVVGAGTGYSSAIVAHLGAEVIGLERCRSLAAAAQARLADLALDNAAVVWADGLAASKGGPFDRILVHAVLADLPEVLTGRLEGGGVLVAARPAPDGTQAIVKHAADGGAVTICSCRLQPLVGGLATM